MTNRGQSLMALLLLALLFLSQGLIWLHPHQHEGVSDLLGLRFNLSEYRHSTFCPHDGADTHVENKDLFSQDGECGSCMTLLQLTEYFNYSFACSLQNCDQERRFSTESVLSACSPLHRKTRAPPSDIS
ncbi:hypothetical protein IJT93_01605 [bacterium]|nr:hypothetical protein [bacterium]